MKAKLFILSLFLPAILFSQNDAIDKFINSHKGLDGYVSINIPKSFLRFAAFIERDDEIARQLLLQIDRVRVLTCEHGDINFYHELIEDIILDEYVEIIRVKESGKNVVILVKDRGNYFEELILLTGGKGENVLIQVRGKIDMAYLADISEKIAVY